MAALVGTDPTTGVTTSDTTATSTTTSDSTDSTTDGPAPTTDRHDDGQHEHLDHHDHVGLEFELRLRRQRFLVVEQLLGRRLLGDDKDCADFASQADAQAALAAEPSDPDNLDADDDGIACEDRFGTPGQQVQVHPTGGVDTGGEPADA